MDSWHSYPKVYAIGHRAIADLFKERVVITEKIDGSQFSFGIFDGEFRARSKGAILNVIAPEKMFELGVEIAQGLPLKEGLTYRGEYLKKPKHNTLAYERVPVNNIILFDINDGHESYLPYDQVSEEAERIGLEIVPRVFDGSVADATQFRRYLDAVSVLGGQKVEGVVAKNYHRFGPDGKVLMGKFVSEAFKEVHNKEWKERNPLQNDIIQKLIADYRTPARWAKSVQHLKESGQLEQSPRDIGLLMKETGKDILEECRADIADKLMKWAWPKVQRGVTSGLPEWYKEELLKLQFEEDRSE